MADSEVSAASPQPPEGAIHPIGISALLERMGIATQGLRAIGTGTNYAKPGAPALDFVFTVCDNAANEVCPVLVRATDDRPLGQPDPAAVDGTDVEKTTAFRDAFRMLERRIALFTSLPIASLDRLALGNKIREIGKS